MSIASRRLWLATDNDIVFEGDPRAAFLLAGEGCEIPAGFVEPVEPVEAVPTPKKAAAPTRKPSPKS